MKAAKVNAGLAESNGKLLQGLWRELLHVTCGLTACTPGSAPGPTLGNEYGKTLPFLNTDVRLLLFVFILRKLYRSVVFVVDVLDSSRYIYNAYYFSACRILVSSNVGLVINFRRTGWVKCGGALL